MSIFAKIAMTDLINRRGLLFEHYKNMKLDCADGRKTFDQALKEAFPKGGKPSRAIRDMSNEAFDCLKGFFKQINAYGDTKRHQEIISLVWRNMIHMRMGFTFYFTLFIIQLILFISWPIMIMAGFVVELIYYNGLTPAFLLGLPEIVAVAFYG